jgi:protein-S-isoprenylcysteine O-methyltransferase Ste14
MPDPVIAVALVACWGTLVVVWIAGAIYNAVRAPREPIRAQSGTREYVAALLVCAIVIYFVRRFGGQYLSVDVAWVRGIGLVILVASTLFALWARFWLGTSWSVDPQVGGDRRLRTEGPYAITRHPIYTGLLGMLLGTTLLAGVGQWIVLVVAGVILFEVKIRQEERLLVTIFPGEYPAYRKRVPQLVPGLDLVRRPR